MIAYFTPEVSSKTCFIFSKNYLYSAENKTYFEIYGKLTFFSSKELFPLQKSSSSARVGLIHNPAIKHKDDRPESLQIARTVEAVLSSKSHVTPAMLKFMENLLDESNDFDKLSSDAKAMADLLAKTPVCVIGSMNFVCLQSTRNHRILN